MRFLCLYSLNVAYFKHCDRIKQPHRTKQQYDGVKNDIRASCIRVKRVTNVIYVCII